jgi:hypothetical protein
VPWQLLHNLVLHVNGCRGALPSAAAKEACYALLLALLEGGPPALLTPPVQAPAGARAPAAARVSFGAGQGPLHACQPLPEDRWPPPGSPSHYPIYSPTGLP